MFEVMLRACGFGCEFPGQSKVGEISVSYNFYHQMGYNGVVVLQISKCTTHEGGT